MLHDLPYMPNQSGKIKHKKWFNVFLKTTLSFLKIKLLHKNKSVDLWNNRFISKPLKCFQNSVRAPNSLLQTVSSVKMSWKYFQKDNLFSFDLTFSFYNNFLTDFWKVIRSYFLYKERLFSHEMLFRITFKIRIKIITVNLQIKIKSNQIKTNLFKTK